jgi:hypothetical protein
VLVVLVAWLVRVLSGSMLRRPAAEMAVLVALVVLALVALPVR